MAKDSTVRRRRAKAPPGSTVKRPIELPNELHQKIDRMAIARGLSWNAIANELLQNHPLIREDS